MPKFNTRLKAIKIALKPIKGSLLVAKPSIIGDVSFNRAVILLVEHSEDGTIGFILNKPLEYSLVDFIPEIKNEIPVHNGGPVEQDNLYYIHTIPYLIANSIPITNGLYWGVDFEQVTAGIQSGTITKNDIQFFLGYSGWDANQLEQEIEGETWVVKENEHQQEIIKKYCPAMWRNFMVALGGSYSVWANAPENPNNN